MNKAAAPLVMSAGQRESLRVLARSSTAAHRQVQRVRFAAEGLAKFGVVRAGRGRNPVISAVKVEEIVRLTQHEKPSGTTHWSCRSMAKAVGVSPAMVQRIWSGRARPRCSLLSMP